MNNLIYIYEILLNNVPVGNHIYSYTGVYLNIYIKEVQISMYIDYDINVPIKAYLIML